MITVTLQAASIPAWTQQYHHDGSRFLRVTVPNVAASKPQAPLVGGTLLVGEILQNDQGQTIGILEIAKLVIPSPNDSATAVALLLDRYQYGFGNHLVFQLQPPSTSTLAQATLIAQRSN